VHAATAAGGKTLMPACAAIHIVVATVVARPHAAPPAPEDRGGFAMP
jgi:hypothetical protein